MSGVESDVSGGGARTKRPKRHFFFLISFPETNLRRIRTTIVIIIVIVIVQMFFVVHSSSEFHYQNFQNENSFLTPENSDLPKLKTERTFRQTLHLRAHLSSSHVFSAVNFFVCSARCFPFSYFSLKVCSNLSPLFFSFWMHNSLFVTLKHRAHPFMP